jgi:anaerobic ribonucleoside-triphosphate reductase activating protein
LDLGERVAVSDLCNRVISLGISIEGITISGGEPLEQIDALTRFLSYIKKHSDLSVLLFSGYSLDEISKMQHSNELLAYVDVLIAGRYEVTLRSSTGLVGSTNQTVRLLTDCYSLNDLKVIPSGEVIISDDGQVIITGIDPLKYELTIGERTNGF